MKTAKNMKELENMILGEIKKKLPGATKDYCHKWYSKHPEMNDIVSESDFVQMVNNSLKVSLHNGEVKASLNVFNEQNIEGEYLEQMKILWEDFKSEYVNYVFTKILK